MFSVYSAPKNNITAAIMVNTGSKQPETYYGQTHLAMDISMNP